MFDFFQQYYSRYQSKRTWCDSEFMLQDVLVRGSQNMAVYSSPLHRAFVKEITALPA
jgi:hypothetical protein